MGTRGMLAVAVVGVVAGALLTLWIRGGREAEPPPPAVEAAPAEEPAPSLVHPDWRAEVAGLRAAIAREQAARQQLASELDDFRESLAQLRGRGGEAGAARADSDAGPPGLEPEADLEQPWFDGDALLAAGVAPSEVERLRRRFAAWQLEELYVHDEAAREGWQGRPRHVRALRQVRQALREEIGDGAYDLLLFAAGKNNRVVVGDLLGDSPGERSGLREGDVIVRYGDERVFNVRDVIRATREGRAGSQTPVQVLRDGEPVYLYVPRGPIGARLQETRGEPASEGSFG